MRSRTRRTLSIAAALAATCCLFAPAPAGAAAGGLVCTNGTTFDLVAKPGYLQTPDGNSVYMWGFGNAATGGAFQVSGPNLCVTQGATVTVHLHNALTGPGAEPVSIVFPGQEAVTATGGSPGLFTSEAALNGDVTYTFTASNAGTYLYESGTDPQKQVEMGLYGALIVRPAACGATTCDAYGGGGTTFDPRREFLVVLNEVDPALHSAVQAGQPYDRGKLHNRYFTVNGRSFPDTIQGNNISYLPSQPYGALVRIKPFDATTNPQPALIRMVNAGLLNHPFHPHGNHLRMIAQDGRRFLTPGGNDASTEHFGETIASGATEDFLLTWKPNPTDPNSPDQPFPASVPVPSYRNLLFKDSNTWYSGSPYLGYKGTLPTGTTSQNVCGEFYYPWHSHALNEFTNFEAGFGGMATLMRVDPPDGCTSFPTSVKLQTGTLRAGGYSNLAKNDDSFYQVNSTAPTTPTPPARTDWYGAFSGLPAGASKLVVTYRGRNSTAGIRQTLALWNWATSTWTTLPVATLATDPSPPNPVVPQPAGTTTAAVGPAEVQTVTVPIANPATYIGKGSFNGQLQVQVVNERASGTGTFFSSGDLMKVTYDAP